MGDKKITISVKTIWAIAPAMAIVGMLLAKDQVGQMVLFILGIGLGVAIGRLYTLGDKKKK